MKGAGASRPVLAVFHAEFRGRDATAPFQLKFCNWLYYLFLQNAIDVVPVLNGCQGLSRIEHRWDFGACGAARRTSWPAVPLRSAPRRRKVKARMSAICPFGRLSRLKGGDDNSHAISSVVSPALAQRKTPGAFRSERSSYCLDFVEFEMVGATGFEPATT